MSKVRRKKAGKLRRQRRAKASESQFNYPAFSGDVSASTEFKCMLAQHELLHGLYHGLYIGRHNQQRPAYDLNTLTAWYLNNATTFYCMNKGKTVILSTINDNEDENEFEIELCCADCARVRYAWSTKQFEHILAKSSGVIKIPNSVLTEEQFNVFVRTL